MAFKSHGAPQSDRDIAITLPVVMRSLMGRIAQEKIGAIAVAIIGRDAHDPTVTAIFNCPLGDVRSKS